ncbi:MAG TPA: hypothetical protein VMT23_01345 [Candidatus Binatia bacterium]|nr:hypothetical protein [Candidatus Binatia bacterium]
MSYGESGLGASRSETDYHWADSGPELFIGDPEMQRTLIDIAGFVSLDRLQNNFSQTEAGRRLATMRRFSKKYQPENYPDSLWIKYLGVQASDLAHGQYTMQQGDQLLAFEPPSTTNKDIASVQRFLFGVANLTHDWGESDPEVDDVIFGDPKPNRAKERQVRSALAEHALRQACEDAGIISQIYPNLDQAISFITDWSDHIAFDKPHFSLLTELGGIIPEEYYQHLYRANKYLGHFVVALRADRVINEQPEFKQAAMKDVYQRLSLEVTHNSLPVLLEYADTFPGIEAFLQGNLEAIDKLVRSNMRVFGPETVNYNDEYDRPLSLKELRYLWLNYKQRSKT